MFRTESNFVVPGADVPPPHEVINPPEENSLDKYV